MYSEVFSDWPGWIVSPTVMVIALVKCKARQKNNKSVREAIRGEIIILGLVVV
jgi:hypothetical protein